jgi:hypothetical protein
MGGDQDMMGTGDPALTTVAARGNQELLRWLGMGLAALAVVGVVVYAASSKPAVRRGVVEQDLIADPEARRLVVELADLEDAFDAGQVDEMTYERRRAEITRELKS